MSGAVDVLAVLASYSGQHGDPEDFEQARAAAAELIEAASFFVNDDRQRAWHSMYREPMGRLRAALARVQGGAK